MTQHESTISLGFDGENPSEKMERVGVAGMLCQELLGLDGAVISTTGDALPYLSDIKNRDREVFKVLHLNARNQVVFEEIIAVGSVSTCIVHPREVFRNAVSAGASSLVLAHNHPSGDVSPSQDDINLTRRLVQAGEIMGIDILDHVIVGKDDFLSLRERGLI